MTKKTLVSPVHIDVNVNRRLLRPFGSDLPFCASVEVDVVVSLSFVSDYSPDNSGGRFNKNQLDFYRSSLVLIGIPIESRGVVTGLRWTWTLSEPFCVGLLRIFFFHPFLPPPYFRSLFHVPSPRNFCLSKPSLGSKG